MEIYFPEFLNQTEKIFWQLNIKEGEKMVIKKRI